MAEYIEREAAIKRFSFATLDCLGMEPTIRAADVVAALKSIPAADVVPVRHGRWEWYDSFSYRCSACEKYWIAPGDQYDYHYCPNCGARMDGDEE